MHAEVMPMCQGGRGCHVVERVDSKASVSPHLTKLKAQKQHSHIVMCCSPCPQLRPAIIAIHMIL